MIIRRTLALAALATLGAASLLGAQWTNRYPKIKGMDHHVYLEGIYLGEDEVGTIRWGS